MTTTDNTIADLIRAKLTTRQIRQLTGADYGRIARVRRDYGLPVLTHTPPPMRTIDEALAQYAEPHGDGHIRWTGPMRGRGPIFEAEGIRYSARAVIFRRHYHRAHLGYIRTTCTVPGCIAGPHLADTISRVTTDPSARTAAITQLIELGASDWQILCHLGAGVHAVTRIRQRLGRTS